MYKKRTSVKPFVDILLWFFIAQIAFLAWLWLSDIEIRRLPVMVISFINFLLLVFSLPVMSHLFRAPLLLKEESITKTPDYIWVLSGGILLGKNKEEAQLNEHTIRRVLKGIALSKKYPTSKLVFAGGRKKPTIDEPIEAKVMEKYALMAGVDKEKIITEGQSEVTREHPIFGLKLKNVSASSNIVVVTEDWHLRRAKQEFDRYFSYTTYVAASVYDEPLCYKDFIPSSEALAESTTYLREWIGLIWYKVKSHL